MPPRARHLALTPANGAGTAGGEAREIEWQLTAPDLATVRRWLERHTSLDGLSIRPLPAQQLHDTYLDTEDWRIFRAGFALRLREKDGEVEATLKGLRSARVDVADRREITEPLPAAKAKALAHGTGPVATRVRDVAGVKPLRALFDIRTSRQRFAVRSRDSAATLGEIALDEARFSRAGRNRRPLILTRVELEAAGPDADPLGKLASRLRAACGLHPAKENKFAVGLRSASLEPPRALPPDGDAGPAPALIAPSTRTRDFAAASLERLLQEWHANEPAARLGEGPEPLHRLRVIGRRMDTVLTVFRGSLPATVGRGRSTLKRLIDALGAVRDADVRLAAASTFRGGVPEGDRLALDPLLRHLQSERAARRSALLRALDAKATRLWLETLPDQLAKVAPRRSSASAPDSFAMNFVPTVVRKRYRKLRRCARRLTVESSPGEFHEARIRAKKLRYVLEIVAPTYARPADEMLAALRGLQARLGTRHDADVVARYLTQLATRPPADFTAATLFLMGKMAERHAREAVRMGAKIAKPWRQVRGRRWKALRARMQELRAGARDDNDKSHGPARGARGNGKLAPASGGPAFPDARGS